MTIPLSSWTRSFISTIKSSVLSFCLVLIIGVFFTEDTKGQSFFPDDTYQSRISNMNCPFTPTYDASVHYVITRYLSNPGSLENLLGRNAIYQHYFEQALAEEGLPTELKYLPIVESGLRANALSHAAAKGLWQFIPETGRRYGLSQSNGVDERCDPIKSSKAAAKYLKFLYNQFGQWDLCLAAYNCGEGRIANTMRATFLGSYQEIKHLLPKETQGYVPNFVAVCYLMQYTREHKIEPKVPDLDMVMAVAINVHRPITFYHIQQATGLSMETIKSLNPHILRQQIQATTEGTFVYVPRRVASNLLDMVNSPESAELDLGGLDVNNFGQTKYMKSSYRVKPGDNMATLAQTFNVNEFTIQQWNANSTYFFPGQMINVWVPLNDFVSDVVVQSNYSMAPIALKGGTPSITPDPVFNNEPAKPKAVAKKAPVKVRYHTVRKGDTMSEIANKYHVEVSALKKANGIKSNVVRVGQKLKIPAK
jgi:membrane-bound lytic murein transglycosylase D